MDDNQEVEESTAKVTFNLPDDWDDFIKYTEEQK